MKSETKVTRTLLTDANSLSFFRWLVAGVFVVVFAVIVLIISKNFAPSIKLADQPIILFAGLMLIAGVLFAGSLKLVRTTIDKSQDTKKTLWLVILIGLAARIILMPSTPIMEDDFNRYLWDGAVTVQGLSPFATSPQDVMDGKTDKVLTDLYQQNKTLVEQINYPEYRTIYPPVTQAFFALAYILKPFSLTTWKIVLLGLEIVSAGLILVLLREFGRSYLWIALYWWNPLVLKEIANSAHMEPVISVFVLGACLLIVRQKFVLAAVAASCAAAAKIWPVILFATLGRLLVFGKTRTFQPQWGKLVLVTAVSLLILAFSAWPIIASGLDSTSGFVAYSKNWQASSALFNGHLALWRTVLDFQTAGTAARIVTVVAFAAILIWIHLKATHLPEDRKRLQPIWWIFLSILALFLLSPAQFPWYFLWIAPLLPLFPMRGLMAASCMLPLHYLYPYFANQDQIDLYINGVVWLIWIPVWILLYFDLKRGDWLEREVHAQ